MRIRLHVTTFRVYPERNRKLYYQVFIFPDKRTMYKFHDIQHDLGRIEYAHGQRKPSKDFWAICQSWNSSHFGKRGGTYPGPSIGQVLFAEPHIKAGIVSHEMTHAALFYAAKKRILPVHLYSGGRQHEAVCRAQGNMVRQFWNGWYNRHEKKRAKR